MTVNEHGRLDQDHPTIGDRLEKLEREAKQAEFRIAQLEQKVGVWPPKEGPLADPLTNKCPACEIDWSGTMGYCCNRTDCPYGVSSTSFPTG